MNLKGCMMSKRMDWETPQYLFNWCSKNFGPFTLDVCATANNAKAEKYYTTEDDGLRQSWDGEFCWMNPPYGRTIGLWVRKAYWTFHRGSGGGLCCALLPARTDTEWWQTYVASQNIIFLGGRVRFVGMTENAPFPSAIVVFREQVLNPIISHKPLVRIKKEVGHNTSDPNEACFTCDWFWRKHTISLGRCSLSEDTVDVMYSCMLHQHKKEKRGGAK